MRLVQGLLPFTIKRTDQMLPQASQNQLDGSVGDKPDFRFFGVKEAIAYSASDFHAIAFCGSGSGNLRVITAAARTRAVDIQKQPIKPIAFCLKS